MASCLICYFIAMLFYIEKKLLLMRNLATILPLKFKLSEKFQRFNIINGAALRKLFSLPSTYSPPDKILLRVWKKIFLIEIYRNIFLFGARNNICIAPFLTPNRNMFSGKFLKSERVVSVLQENIVLSVKVVEICKMSEVF